MSIDSLTIFSIYTKNWFTKTLGAPTKVQDEAWPSIKEGKHTLVSAPTGTGKTLSAFLVFIDKLREEARNGTLKEELHLIYVSPLKSLASDIRENLRRPLSGIMAEECNDGLDYDLSNTLTLGIRTGDTPQSERKRMIKHPPHILITTPESLYLMLSSKTGKSILATAKAIIIDELHAVIESKRGAHLMLSIARLDKLCKEPLQRIGLSATMKPLEVAAEFLSPDPVTIIAPKMEKGIHIQIKSPIAEAISFKKNPVWQEVASAVYESCKGAKSVIAFVEGRAYAEKLAYYVNQIAGEGFARIHHGSLSKEQRLETEQALRDGELRLLCATSSMELGIDVGDIEEVYQIGCPRSISSTMQRLGRAGHNPNHISIMKIFTRTKEESLYSGLTAKVLKEGKIEPLKPPIMCLDVLAQHLVSMATDDGYHVDEVMEILPRTYTFRNVTKEDVKAVLKMLAGDYEHDRNIPVRPRILYDRIHDTVLGDAYSRMLSISAAGTIPDKGEYAVKTENGVKIGELDEEFIFESRIGDKFLFGTFAWQISGIQKDTVIVKPSATGAFKLPFWKGEVKGRRLQTGLDFGQLFRRLNHAYYTNTLDVELEQLSLSDQTLLEVKDYITHQIEVTQVLPDDRTIIIEHFRDETGNFQMMVHSIFGRGVNAPLAILAREMARRQTNMTINSVDDDDGFLLFPYDGSKLPEGILQSIQVESARKILEALLISTPLFNITFRYNVANSLMMGVKKAGRQPLWVQRMRSAQMLDNIIPYKSHPLIRETIRECLEDYWDLPGLEYVLNGIRSGYIHIREIELIEPSPMSFILRQQTEASQMYNYAPTPQGVYDATNSALKDEDLLQPDKVQLDMLQVRKKLPENEEELHTLLMIEGDFVAGELELPFEWLESLVGKDKVAYIEPGLWIACEHLEIYESALIQNDFEVRKQIVLRLLRYRGPFTIEQLAIRYVWSKEQASIILSQLLDEDKVVLDDGLYYQKDLYERARIETIKSLRRQIKTLPSERYASLISNKTRYSGTPLEQLEKSLRLLSSESYPLDLWESIILPSRVNAYRPELMEQVLSSGNVFWKIEDKLRLTFYQYDLIDWDIDLSHILDSLEDNERILYDALLKRGASFMQRLTCLLDGISPYDPLLSLAEKGYIFADSFVPIRQLINKDKLNKGSVKVRVSAIAKAMTQGRWEMIRPLKALSIEDHLELLFDQVVILSKETIKGIPWSRALEVLRIWEFTGRVRRGYFIDGLSGIQFIRDKEFQAVMDELEHPITDIIWLNGIDNALLWGKSLSHYKDRSYMNIPGNFIALSKGIPVCIFEKQGKVLRSFDDSKLYEALKQFVIDFTRKRVYTALNRVVVKQYPKEAVEAIIQAGFKREMNDYVLYRS